MSNALEHKWSRQNLQPIYRVNPSLSEFIGILIQKPLEVVLLAGTQTARQKFTSLEKKVRIPIEKWKGYRKNKKAVKLQFRKAKKLVEMGNDTYIYRVLEKIDTRTSTVKQRLISKFPATNEDFDVKLVTEILAEVKAKSIDYMIYYNGLRFYFRLVIPVNRQNTPFIQLYIFSLYPASMFPYNYLRFNKKSKQILLPKRALLMRRSIPGLPSPNYWNSCRIAI